MFAGTRLPAFNRSARTQRACGELTLCARRAAGRCHRQSWRRRRREVIMSAALSLASPRAAAGAPLTRTWTPRRSLRRRLHTMCHHYAQQRHPAPPAATDLLSYSLSLFRRINVPTLTLESGSPSQINYINCSTIKQYHLFSMFFRWYFCVRFPVNTTFTFPNIYQ